MTDWAAVRARLKAAREAKRWTQRELGDAIGVSAVRIAQLETKVPPSEKVLAQLAQALGRSVVWLRYGVVADGADAGAIRAEGFADGVRAAAKEMLALVTAMQYGTVPATSLPPAEFLPDPTNGGTVHTPAEPHEAYRPARKRA